MNTNKQIKIIKGNLVKLKVDAIVNAADTTLSGGGGIDGVIHRAAGPKLYDACAKLHGCPTGQAKITPGFNLPAKYIIHTVGPIYKIRTNYDKEEMLKNCYRNSLNLAMQYNVHSVAFPAISTGVYGYPPKNAAYTAYATVKQWLKQHSDYDLTVTLCAYDNKTYQYYLNAQGEDH